MRAVGSNARPGVGRALVGRRACSTCRLRADAVHEIGARATCHARAQSSTIGAPPHKSLASSK
eukprot:4348395-Lingulodinium_polyedra.AAC.1